MSESSSLVELVELLLSIDENDPSNEQNAFLFFLIKTEIKSCFKQTTEVDHPRTSCLSICASYTPPTFKMSILAPQGKALYIVE